MGAGGPQALLARESELLEDFLRLTREQHEILTRAEPDERELNESLARRRKVLNELAPLFAELEKLPEAQPSRARSRELLEQARDMDEQNLELCGSFMKSLGDQARQMTQSRKVVLGYGKSAESAVETSGFFDKRQ